ncbi:MAG: ATP-binding cassette domain-containing protein [Candidatus Hydrogenedentes bacterium]|nr:ATP-binding cassette domain-containing protein [Candidatus Hydrogenedentota bacterium]
MNQPILRLSDITKRFGGVSALCAAQLEVCAGEVHGLVGENGAGKSTLINIATGVLRPDDGAILLDGGPVALSNPRQASAHGIAVVHQEADLFAQLSIAENMLLGQGLLRRRTGLIDWRRTYREAGDMVSALGESLDVRATAGGLSVARRMMAEIAAAVSEKARVLFLDEPTSSLTLKEIEHLFGQIRRLRDAGVGIVYVSHRLEEVLEICDRVTVMRDGETIETQPAVGLTMDRIVSAMVGRDLKDIFLKRAVPIGDTRLEVAGATDARGAFRDVSLDVRAGEIVGLYGFVGAGRSELGQALFGLRRLQSGTARIDGRPLRARTPRSAVRQGVAYLPEDRLVQAVFPGHALRANASVAMLRNLAVAGWVPAGAERGLAGRVMRDMNVRAASMEQPMGALSGGNQQKVVFGRWQSTAPKVLILDEPTRGVDVGAKAEIHKLICDLAEQGTAILLISSELPEVMAMSDRVVTLSEGRMTGQFNPKTDSEEAIAAAAVPRVEETTRPPARTPARSLLRLLQFREVGLIGFIAVLSGIMAYLRPGEFATVDNFLDVLASAAVPAIMAQGAMLIICAGGIDISVGSMMGLVGALVCLAAKGGLPAPLCLLLAVALGCAFSMMNGGTALLARIHPIIVTLAGISIYRGIMRVATGGDEVLQLPDAYRALAEGRLFGVPKLCIYVVVVTVLVHILLRHTLWGRRVLALGNSTSAARLIGLSAVRLTLSVFAVSGALVGLCAVLHSGYYSKVEAGMGAGMELRAIAAAVIGGTNILGGRGSAFGTFLGAFLVALLPNVLIFAQSSDYWQNLFVGGLILLAVVVDVLLQRMREGRA